MRKIIWKANGEVAGDGKIAMLGGIQRPLELKNTFFLWYSKLAI